MERTRILNCSLKELDDRLVGKRVIVFGTGSYLKTIETPEILKHVPDIVYCIDNNEEIDEVYIGGKKLRVYRPDKLAEENDCVVLITSPIYMYDMYAQIKEMNLDKEIVCYAMPFVMLESDREYNKQYIEDETLFDGKTLSISKTIHSFWFSGEEKPDLYKRCLESWYVKLPDYNIIEWDLENYKSGKKNSFFDAAIDARAWAFASDYARLDVLNRYGGIYLDMDVEVFKPFDRLLQADAFFPFSNPAFVNLAACGAKQGHPVIKKLLALYDGITPPTGKGSFSGYYQPGIVKKVFAEEGVEFNGHFQIIDNTFYLPSTYLMPLEVVCFEDKNITDYTYAIHYDNFGWSTGKNLRMKKIEDNRKLKKMIQES